jgi:hypothetical protein
VTEPVLHEKGCRLAVRSIHGCACSDAHVERVTWSEWTPAEREAAQRAYAERQNKARVPESPTRCYDCGAWRLPRCADHPASEGVAWGRKQAVAWEYVQSVSLGGILSFYDAAPHYYPGVSRDDLVWVSSLHERWGGRLPEEVRPERKAATSPRGLFG